MGTSSEGRIFIGDMKEDRKGVGKWEGWAGCLTDGRRMHWVFEGEMEWVFVLGGFGLGV